MKRWPLLLLAASASCAPDIASACAPPAPARPIAGETMAQYRARNLAEINARAVESAREREALFFEQAVDVYFATVIRSDEVNVTGSYMGRQVTVQPVRTIKGSLPDRQVQIRDRVLTSCGFGGDGPATSGHVGQVAIVFDGLHRGSISEPGLYAIMAEDAHEPRLIAARNEWDTLGFQKR